LEGRHHQRIAPAKQGTLTAISQEYGEPRRAASRWGYSLPFGGCTRVFVHDPFGNCIELMERL
jgi:hypothetical protein